MNIASIYFLFKDWTILTFEPLGSLGLFLLAFAESSFFPIPPDILLIVLSLSQVQNAYWFALIATIGSVLGGIAGYGIGCVGEKFILERFFSKNKIEKVHKLFNKYESLAVFIGGFTPLPYKLFTITAGMFYLNFKKFIMVSFLSRGLRFFLVAFLITKFHESIDGIILNYANIITLLIAAVMIGYILLKKLKK